ncbi:hypothetical protein ACWGKS_27135 [Nocardiopsis sp. NPDC055879]
MGRREENTSQPGIVNMGGNNSFTNTAFGKGATIKDGKVVKGTKLPDTKKDKKK